MQYRLGVVLSGGGSRGLVHAGVLGALREAGIEPECLSGTSAGAIVGALYAGGYDTAATLEFFETTSPFRLSRLASFGKPGLLDTTKIEEDFLGYFPENSFEALDRKLFVTATDLVEGDIEIFSSGPLVRPLLASASIPMVFTPTEFQGRLFADGGIVDNFPVDPLLGLCDVLLGVYASPLAHLADPAFDNSFEVTQRALEIGMFHASERKFHQVDLVLASSELRRYGTFDAKRHAEIVELGEEIAREQLDAIRELLDRKP
ncbi:MAG TPA: patatin-like phospholipase family protein [Thermoanaerobaculia bacterium]|nr:patatin-like phospholipase family protein [Thermoanaerobaculia bacterium]